jgi:hypothetical protein
MLKDWLKYQIYQLEEDLKEVRKQDGATYSPVKIGVTACNRKSNNNKFLK